MVLHMDNSKLQSAMQLKEHLQQLQEPFSLHDYLIERSYMFKNFTSDCSSTTHSIYSTKNLKWSIKYDLQRNIRTRFLRATEILRSTFYKLMTTVDNDNQEIEITDTKENQQRGEPCSLKRFAMSHHFTDIDVEDKNLPFESHGSTIEDMFDTFTLPKLRRSSEVDPGTKQSWMSTKESECEETLSNTGNVTVCQLNSPETLLTHLEILSQKPVRDPVFSTYLRKLLLNSNILKFRRARNRRILQKSNKLVKEEDFQKIEVRSGSSKEVSKYGHFRLLEKHYREVRKITQMLHTEQFVMSEEWKSFQIVNWKIMVEIGDSIMDDIVTEIIDLF